MMRVKETMRAPDMNFKSITSDFFDLYTIFPEDNTAHRKQYSGNFRHPNSRQRFISVPL
jgi:hypothetical protein